MNIENFKRIIQYYLQGKLTEGESKRVDSWYQSITDEDINPFHDTAHRHAVKDELFERLVPAVRAERKKAAQNQRFRWLSAAAAFVLLGVSALLFFRDNQSALNSGATVSETQLMQTVTKAGELREIFLPDGTSVFLNGNAQIRYDKINYGKNRTIFLDRGEAFFKVKRDTLHPFKIASGAISVAVLGTSFNVNRSQASGQVTVEVKTGRVKVFAEENGEQHILTRGKAARYSLAKKHFEIFDQHPSTVNLWTQGGMLLNNVGFDALKEIIYNRYGVVLIADNLDTDKFNYSLMIPQVESLDQVLNMICTIHQIKFRREKNEIILHK